MWTQKRIDAVFNVSDRQILFRKFKAILDAIEGGGMPVNAAESKYGYTALHVAVIQSSAAHVRRLLELGADPTKRNRYGASAMHFTAWTCTEPLQKCKCLPTEGLAYVDNYGQTPLHFLMLNPADMAVSMRITRRMLRWMLVQPACAANARNSLGMTAADVAQYQRRHEGLAPLWSDADLHMLDDAMAVHTRWSPLRAAWVGAAVAPPSQLLARPVAMFTAYPSITNRAGTFTKTAAGAVPPGTAWVVTPKIHGTNTSITVIRGGGLPLVARRNAFLKPGETHYGYQEVLAPWMGTLPRLLDRFPAARQVTVYGELYGGLWPGVTSAGAVQREVLYSPQRRFVAFDVAVDGVFLPFYDARTVLHAVAPTMPFTAVAFTSCEVGDAVAWARDHADDEAVPAAAIATANLPPLTKPNPGEGWVVRPVVEATLDDERVMLKVKGAKFCEGGEGGEGAGAAGAAGAGRASAVPVAAPNPYLTTGRITSVLSKQSEADCTIRNVQALAKLVCSDIAADGGVVPTASEACKALVSYFRDH
jgi:hypothetical protein